MTEEQLKLNRRHFEIIGATVCAQCFGYFLWLMNLPSDGELVFKDNLNYMFYLSLTFTCYFSAFWVLDRYLSPIGNIRPNWAIIPLLGTSLAFIISILPQAFDGWHQGFTESEFLLRGLGSLGILNMSMLFIMGFIWVIGFIVRLVGKEIEEFKVLPD